MKAIAEITDECVARKLLAMTTGYAAPAVFIAASPATATTHVDYHVPDRTIVAPRVTNANMGWILGSGGVNTKAWSLARSVALAAGCGGGATEQGDHGGESEESIDPCDDGQCGETNTDVYYDDDACYFDDQCDPGADCVAGECVERPSLPQCETDSIGPAIPWAQAGVPVLSLAFVDGAEPAILAVGEVGIEWLAPSTPAMMLAGGIVPVDAVGADLDGDGIAEVIATDGAQVYRWVRDRGAGFGEPMVLLDVALDRVFIADATGDGLLDLVGRSPDHHTIVLAPAIGDDAAGGVVSVPLSAPAEAAAIGDVDGDGDSELVVALENPEAPWTVGIVDLGAEPTVRVLDGEHESITTLAVGRLNDDALDDLSILGDDDGGTILTVALSVSNGAIAQPTLALGGSYPVATIGAFGRDGVGAIVLGNASELRVVESSLGTPSCYRVYVHAAATALGQGDLDGDGVHDLIGAVGNEVAKYSLAE